MTFPRGSGPLVSILLPTRGRPEHLIKTIESLHNLAADPSRIEYLLYIDSDDAATLQIAPQLCDQLRCRYIVGRRVGYRNMHLMVNQLCAVAEGDWPWLFNDDALNRTQGWDAQIAALTAPEGFGGSPEIAMFGVNCPGYSPWVFPAIRRETYKALGHYSLHCCNDTYLEKVLRPLGAYFTISSITVEHFQGMQDETRQGSLALPSSDWEGPGWLRDAIEQDRAKLRRYMDNVQEWRSLESA